jgi:hypothetical protein
MFAKWNARGLAPATRQIAQKVVKVRGQKCSSWGFEAGDIQIARMPPGEETSRFSKTAWSSHTVPACNAG